MKLLLIIHIFWAKQQLKNITRHQASLNTILTELVSSKCFAKIKIDMDTPCKNKKMLEKCKFPACKLPNDYENQLKKINTTLCRYGELKNRRCNFYDPKTRRGLFVDLDMAKQIYSGYKKGAAEIWKSIYKDVCGNHTLYKMVSGIHFSIGIHMSVFFKKVNDEYFSSMRLYRQKYKREYANNLLYAFKIVSNAASKLNSKSFKCAIEFDRKNKKLLNEALSMIKSMGLFKDTYISCFNWQSRLEKVMEHLNCIECDKCKLWGKIQFKGLYVTYKILCSDNNKIRLAGDDIVCFFHLYHKLCSSVLYMKKLDKAKNERWY
ncbi:hypothetical protein EDEG_01607 [Edhazardia aedis USNM 41457]|uniref:Endoplasmic oxidoreductin-1 n=1 Tax=Edhazardia aedis (strain USNM 41457) TaxID=1003232 RepID=J9DNI0_EDHAE|nr:hypothetical protein EDEG_01607 [Edhazardia aedis USNM 41457]|eukprot:EJW04085.1 hypothetical protein EDEG_01607 [Edhazardia aedis USNM 41457]